MKRNQLNFLFLNAGHFLDHFMVLIFATAAALRLTEEWGIGYAALIPYATPSFVAFGLCSIPAGWLADRWSREGMMVVFFVGIGSSAVLAGLADGPLQIAIGLTLIGAFAAIYHPVGLAMVVHGRDRTGLPLAVNGVYGNLGVASAALCTGLLIDASGWRSAFIAPGLFSIFVGMIYWWFVWSGRRSSAEAKSSDTAAGAAASATVSRDILFKVFAIIIFTTGVGGLIFQSTTFALPKVLDEQLADLAGTATLVGWYTFLVFAGAALAQLVVGYLVDHHSVRTIFAWIAVLQATFFAVMTQATGIAAFFVAVAFMLMVFGQVPINDVLVGRMVRSEWRSRAYALRYIVTFSVMASAVPLIAWVYGNWGFGALFGILSAAAVTVFVAVMLLPRAAHRVQTR